MSNADETGFKFLNRIMTRADTPVCELVEDNGAAGGKKTLPPPLPPPRPRPTF